MPLRETSDGFIVFILLIIVVIFLPLEITSPNGLLIDIPLLILMFIVHELLHAVGFRFFGKAKSKNITYGVNLEKGVFYCTCKEEISKKGNNKKNKGYCRVGQHKLNEI